MKYTPPFKTITHDNDRWYPSIQIRDAEDKHVCILPLDLVRAILAVRAELEDFAGRHENDG